MPFPAKGRSGLVRIRRHVLAPLARCVRSHGQLGRRTGLPVPGARPPREFVDREGVFAGAPPPAAG
jgi:hypothetical protein